MGVDLVAKGQEGAHREVEGALSLFVKVVTARVQEAGKRGRQIAKIGVEARSLVPEHGHADGSASSEALCVGHSIGDGEGPGLSSDVVGVIGDRFREVVPLASVAQGSPHTRDGLVGRSGLPGESPREHPLENVLLGHLVRNCEGLVRGGQPGGGLLLGERCVGPDGVVVGGRRPVDRLRDELEDAHAGDVHADVLGLAALAHLAALPEDLAVAYHPEDDERSLSSDTGRVADAHPRFESLKAVVADVIEVDG